MPPLAQECFYLLVPPDTVTSTGLGKAPCTRPSKYRKVYERKKHTLKTEPQPLDIQVIGAIEKQPSAKPPAPPISVLTETAIEKPRSAQNEIAQGKADALWAGVFSQAPKKSKRPILEPEDQEVVLKDIPAVSVVAVVSIPDSEPVPLPSPPPVQPVVVLGLQADAEGTTERSSESYDILAPLPTPIPGKPARTPKRPAPIVLDSTPSAPKMPPIVLDSAPSLKQASPPLRLSSVSPTPAHRPNRATTRHARSSSIEVLPKPAAILVPKTHAVRVSLSPMQPRASSPKRPSPISDSPPRPPPPLKLNATEDRALCRNCTVRLRPKQVGYCASCRVYHKATPEPEGSDPSLKAKKRTKSSSVEMWELPPPQRLTRPRQAKLARVLTDQESISGSDSDSINLATTPQKKAVRRQRPETTPLEIRGGSGTPAKGRRKTVNSPPSVPKHVPRPVPRPRPTSAAHASPPKRVKKTQLALELSESSSDSDSFVVVRSSP